MKNAQDLYTKANYKDAAKLYVEQIKANPNDDLSHQGLARCMFQMGDFSGAWSEANRALELKPDLAISHLILSNIYFASKRYVDAETEARKAIGFAPIMSEMYCNLGNILSAQNRFEESSSMFKQAISLDPKLWKNHFNFSLIYIKQNQYQDSMREAKRAFWLHPSFQTAYWIFCIFLSSRNNRILTTIVFLTMILVAFLVPSAISLGIQFLLLAFLICFDIGEIMYGKRNVGIRNLILSILLGTIFLIFGKPLFLNR